MWKDIIGWEGLYEVSSDGLVRNKTNGHIRIFDDNSAGYKRVTLYRKGHVPEKERFLVHRLVATHFIPNPNNLPEVNHIDGDTSNNSIQNLEWIDRKGNELYSRKFGRKSYKPFCVEYLNGTKELYDSKPVFANKINVTRGAIRAWLNSSSGGYLSHGIKNIYYI